MEPSGELAAAIADVTAGAVMPMDWARATSAAWDAKPAARAGTAA